MNTDKPQTAETPTGAVSELSAGVDNWMVAGETLVGQLSPGEVTLLAFSMNAPMLYRCCQMAIHGDCTWAEAMQTAAIEQAKVIERQQAELARLMSMTNEEVDRLLRTPIPGESQAKDWFLPHDTERGLENVRDVVRHLVSAEREACAVAAWMAGMDVHTKALGMPCDAREVGSAGARAIRMRYNADLTGR